MPESGEPDCACRALWPLSRTAPRAHWLGNVLEVLRPKVVANNLDLAPDLPIGVIRHTNSARLGNAFQPCGNIDAVAENVVVIKNDVTDMDTDTKFDPLILRHTGVLFGNTTLNLDRASRRVHGAGELDQRAVAGGLDDAASVGGYSGVSKGVSDSLQPGQRAFFVSTHQTAVSGNIHRQNSR